MGFTFMRKYLFYYFAIMNDTVYFDFHSLSAVFMKEMQDIATLRPKEMAILRIATRKSRYCLLHPFASLHGYSLPSSSNCNCCFSPFLQTKQSIFNFCRSSILCNIFFLFSVGVAQEKRRIHNTMGTTEIRNSKGHTYANTYHNRYENRKEKLLENQFNNKFMILSILLQQLISRTPIASLDGTAVCDSFVSMILQLFTLFIYFWCYYALLLSVVLIRRTIDTLFFCRWKNTVITNSVF